MYLIQLKDSISIWVVRVWVSIHITLSAFCICIIAIVNYIILSLIALLPFILISFLCMSLKISKRKTFRTILMVIIRHGQFSYSIWEQTFELRCFQQLQQQLQRRQRRQLNLKTFVNCSEWSREKLLYLILQRINVNGVKYNFFFSFRMGFLREWIWMIIIHSV